MTTTVTVRTTERRSRYEISIGTGVLSAVGEWAAASLQNNPGRIVVISNAKVSGLYGKGVVRSLSRAGFKVGVHLIGDGERYKNLATLERALSFFAEFGLARTDAVVALGGGVIGDLAGFASAVYLRGIDFLQVPTTLLAMIDSSVGGKTGVNLAFGKNLVGSFYQPRGVLIDTEVLETLSRRELTAGFCEAVKQGAIGGRRLFDTTAEHLIRYGPIPRSKYPADGESAESLEALLAAQISFKSGIVAADEREAVDRVDARSRKVLNFGHTLGHALEKVTKYRYFKHGEAVGHGIRFAAGLSKSLGLMAQDEVNLLYDVVHRVGKLPPLDGIDPREVFATFRYDKKLVNNSLQWILLEKLGKPIIVPHTNIPKPALLSVFKEISR